MDSNKDTSSSTANLTQEAQKYIDPPEISSGVKIEIPDHFEHTDPIDGGRPDHLVESFAKTFHTSTVGPQIEGHKASVSNLERIVSQKSDAFQVQKTMEAFAKEQNSGSINFEHTLRVHGQHLEEMTLPENGVRKALNKTTLDAWKLPYKASVNDATAEETSSTSGAEEIEKMGEEITDEIHEEVVKAEEAGEDVMAETKIEQPQMNSQMASPQEQPAVQTAEKKNDPQELPEDLIKAVEWREKEHPSVEASEQPGENKNEDVEVVQQVDETSGVTTSETKPQDSVAALNVGKALDELSKQLQSVSENAPTEEVPGKATDEEVTSSPVEISDQAPVVDVKIDAPQEVEAPTSVDPTIEIAKPEQAVSTEPVVDMASANSEVKSVPEVSVESVSAASAIENAQSSPEASTEPATPIEVKNDQTVSAASQTEQDEERTRKVAEQLKDLNNAVANAQEHVMASQATDTNASQPQGANSEPRPIQTAVLESAHSKKRGGLFSWLTGFSQNEQSK